ncbi:sodium-dependent transporter [Actinomyces sp. oral taxon 170]|uniref:sodium-dependent transporter n=1 Tax=Actinomyces sp. oral taxon 170 TaxID=712117 RepID=UPI000205DBC0|nr:sodium-dependent transporter [Actinomyces sp. oral taxon 170]EGF53817.1 Sodium:neurotransmitter symporter family protein [Actinomyces sp. oral taxon 170 str. F0386]
MTSRTGESESPQAPPREQWSGQLGFLMAAIGSAIGLGNIWRFPGVAYTNGGGAFVVPYVIALLAAGLPILLLDYALGHRFRGSTPAVFRRMSSKLEWLGWFQGFICFVIMTYYAVVVAWSLCYMFFSFTIAWGDDAAGFFQRYIGMDRLGSEVGYSPAVVVGVAIPLLFVWAFGLVVTALGVSDGVERANRIFLPLLVLMFAALVVRALMLPGAGEGLNALFTPKWSALLDYKVWMAALGQIFLSLSVGFGVMLTYASYLQRRRSNLVGTGLVAGFANSSFELLAGIGVFATLGFMANAQNTSVDKLENIAGPSLSFITFPTVISQMPGGALFGVLFFASFAMAGLTSFISIIQVVSAGFGEKLGLSPRTASLVVSIPAAVLSFILFATSSGLPDLDVVDAFINNIGVVASAIIMCVVVAWVLRRTRLLQDHLNAVSESRMVGLWWRVFVGGIVPVLLGYMFFQTLWSYMIQGYDTYPNGFVMVFGWGMLLLVALATAIMTLVPWKTPVDEFEPLELEVTAEEED